MLDSKEQAIGYVKFSSRYFTNTALGYDDYYPFGKRWEFGSVSCYKYKAISNNVTMNKEVNYFIRPLDGELQNVPGWVIRTKFYNYVFKRGCCINNRNYAWIIA